MKRVACFWLCGVLVLLAIGCAATRYEEYGEPAVEREGLPLPEAGLPFQNALAALEARVGRLEAELAGRVGGLETLHGDLTTRLMSLGDQVGEVRKQLQSLQEGVGTDATAAAPANTWDLVRLYEQGLMDYSSRRYREAKEVLREVMAREPQGDLADNARYWVGECDYALKDYRAALASFREIFNYRKTEKYDDAQLKIGLCYLRLGDDANALIELKRLIVDYPESEYSGRAETLIQKVRERVRAEP